MANTGALGGADQRAAARSASVNPTVGTGPGQANPSGYGSIADVANNALASGNWGTSAVGSLLGQAAPQLAQYGTQGALASYQMGQVVPETGLQSQEMQSQGQYSAANALLNYQGLGLQSQALGSSAETAAAQQGIEQSQYGIQQGQYPEQLQQAALQNANAQRGLTDQGAISGTLNTTGQKRAQETQAAQYNWQQADIYRQQQLSQLAQQSQQVGYGGQQEQIANQMQQLGIAGQQQGLSAQQAQNQMNFGLQQLGYQGQDAVMQYAAQVAAAQAGEAQTLAGVGSAAGMISGLGAAIGGSMVPNTGSAK